jgi:hypothetical protein
VEEEIRERIHEIYGDEVSVVKITKTLLTPKNAFQNEEGKFTSDNQYRYHVYFSSGGKHHEIQISHVREVERKMYEILKNNA